MFCLVYALKLMIYLKICKLNELAGDHGEVVKKLKTKLGEFNSAKLYNALNRFGTKSAQKKLRPLLEGNKKATT